MIIEISLPCTKGSLSRCGMNYQRHNWPFRDQGARSPDLRTEIEFLSTSLQEERQSAMTERKTAEDRLRSTLRAGEVHRSNLDETVGKLKHAEKRAEQLKMQQAEDEKKHSSRIAQLERDNSMLLSSKKEAERLLKGAQRSTGGDKARP